MPKGWECPKCGRVYSLMVTECRACNERIDARERRPIVDVSGFGKRKPYLPGADADSEDRSVKGRTL